MEQKHIFSAGQPDGSVLTRDAIRRRLAARTLGVRGNGIPDDGRNTRAAVLVPLVERADAWYVLLTLRAADLADHAGQISFPGGRIDPEDAGEDEAALREAEEEIGLPRGHVEVAGRLDTWVSGTGFVITPVVGLVRPPEHLVPSPVEVAEIFEVPLAFILDKNNHQQRSRELRGKRREFWVLPYQHRNIWGATAGMLVNLAEALTG
jgi:8-oxo-dGTP pyrophosphatase MutT (NUDIX family)